MRQFLNKSFQVLRMALRSFVLDDGFNLAAGLSFFAILSTIPMILIVISLLGHFLGRSEQLFEQVSAWLMATIPQVQPEFIEFLRQLVDKKLTSGWIGIGFLFFVASLLFANLEKILDKVLKSGKRRNFWHSSLFSIAVLIVTALLFFIPALLNPLLAFIKTQGFSIEYSSFLRSNLAYFLAHAGVFLVLLKIVPNQALRMNYIAVGAMLFAGLIVLVRQIFHWYMGVALERYHFIYGSLTVLVVLVLWIYYLSVLFVFCAEVVSALQRTSLLEAPGE